MAIYFAGGSLVDATAIASFAILCENIQNLEHETDFIARICESGSDQNLPKGQGEISFCPRVFAIIPLSSSRGASCRSDLLILRDCFAEKRSQ
jgi:hypothetical protein